MNTKNTLHIISLERKMISVLMWYPITSQQATPIAPPKATPTCSNSVYRYHACLEFRRVLPIYRKSRHVSTTHTNELQHMLLWMVGRWIGSTVVWSRKIKSFAYMRIFWDDFLCFWEALAQLLILRLRNLLRPMMLESRKKSENSCSCNSASQLVRTY